MTRNKYEIEFVYSNGYKSKKIVYANSYNEAQNEFKKQMSGTFYVIHSIICNDTDYSY